MVQDNRLSAYCKQCDLLSQKELHKARLLAYYYAREKGVMQFTVSEAAEWFESVALPRPNTSRLAKNMTRSRVFVRGSKPKTYRLPAQELEILDQQYNLGNDDEVLSHDTILPSSVYSVRRPYIESLARQINASYENRIYDGCAVLMRRLLEVLLILSYRNLTIESEIRDVNGDYLMLNGIVKNAKANGTLALSRTTKPFLDTVKKLGDFSAHRIEYTCKKESISDIIIEYRVTIEELLHKAGLITP